MRPGPMPKEEGRKQGRYQRPIVPLSGNALSLDKYPPDEDWRPDVKDDWATFWNSDVAHAVAESDIPALYRLFDLRNMERLFHEAALAEPTVVGSKGQTVLNPLLRQADSIRAEIRQLEDRFGLNPAARAKLGIDTSKLRKSLADLNEVVVNDAEEEDPRAD